MLFGGTSDGPHREVSGGTVTSTSTETVCSVDSVEAESVNTTAATVGSRGTNEEERPLPTLSMAARSESAEKGTESRFDLEFAISGLLERFLIHRDEEEAFSFLRDRDRRAHEADGDGDGDGNGVGTLHRDVLIVQSIKMMVGLSVLE